MNLYRGDPLGGKSGNKTETLNPAARPASSAQESGPSHPPDMIMEPWGNVATSAWTGPEAGNFLDPTIPILITNDITTENIKKSIVIRHHLRSFMGCFSLTLRKNIDYEGFKIWKNAPTPEKSHEIADIIVGHITNHYDFITTAPPSKNRNINHYCCFELCRIVSEIISIPFVISFAKRVKKSDHGRFSSLRSEMPVLLPGWEYTGKSILFIDDFITSGMTAKTCYDILRSFNNHVDGLIYCQF